MLTPSVDLATLLYEEEENLKLWQIDMMHVSIMDLLGDPGNPLPCLLAPVLSATCPNVLVAET